MALSDDPQPLDPKAPATPAAFPIKTLDDLLSRSYFQSFHYPFNKANMPLPPAAVKPPERGRVLVCHDMAGNYLDDKWVQGGSNPDAYAIWHWYLIDVFVYFSHHLVTLPPPTWTNAAHKHGVKVLGTFILEGDDGLRNCDTILTTEESARSCAVRLTELATSLGFDGWLLNIEVTVEAKKIPNLKEFISSLTQTMHSQVPGSLVIWYDAVTIDGAVDYQNQLNDSNKPFFDICDGIFTNYWWQENFPKQSADNAGNRKFDVYMGIDVFGRGTYGGGKWNTYVALDVLKKDDISAALYAPGWVYENKEPPDFQTAQNRWWSLIEKSWGTTHKYPNTLPFYSNFDQGHGYHFFVEGEQISEAPWCNLSSQSFQPFLKFPSASSSDTIQVLVNFKEASYSGGGSITFEGTLDSNKKHSSVAFIPTLFEAELLMGDLPIQFTYSVRSPGNSMLGLLLEFRTPSGGTKVIYLASGDNIVAAVNQFASKYSNEIIPRQVTKLEASSGWVIHQSSITLEGCVLTKISAGGYFGFYPGTEDGPANSTSQSRLHYYAALGHIQIKTRDKNFEFPPSDAWLVEDEDVKWTQVSDPSKSLSLRISWKLKDEYSIPFPKYNIYVHELSEKNVGHSNQMFEGDPKPKFIGVAHVEAFYVSDLVVPSGTSAIIFIIQVCSLDGATQALDGSPSLRLDVKGQGVDKTCDVHIKPIFILELEAGSM